MWEHDWLSRRECRGLSRGKVNTWRADETLGQDLSALQSPPGARGYGYLHSWGGSILSLFSFHCETQLQN